MTRLNEKGIINLTVFAIVGAILLIGGAAAWRIAALNGQKDSTLNTGQATDSESTISDPANEEADEANQIDENKEDKNETKEASPTETPTTPTVPEKVVNQPQPNYELYNSPQEEYASLEPTTVYVVNKNGAKLAASEQYYSTSYVKTLPFGAEAQAFRQDGTGASSMSLYYDGVQYTANPADFRTTYPYN